MFQIEISKAYGKFEWHEDIKKVLKMAGEANQKVMNLKSMSCALCCTLVLSHAKGSNLSYLGFYA